MAIDGNFKQIGYETLKQLSLALKNDQKIDKSEFEKIKLSTMADGNKTKGEIDLLNKIEDSLNKKININASDFEPKNKSLNFDLKIGKKNVLVIESKEEDFSEKISPERICNFLDSNFDKLKNKDGRIDLQSLEKSLRNPNFNLDNKKIIDRVTQNLNLFLDKDVKSFSDMTIPPFGISKEDISRVKNLSKGNVSAQIKNKILNLESKTFRSDEHLKIIDKASKVNISNDVKEWTLTDSGNYFIRKTKVIDKSNGNDFINKFKDDYIKSHKEVIKEASKMYSVPEKLLAGVLYKEVGGMPYELDTLSYLGRKYLPEKIKDITGKLSGDKQLTSVGNVSIQIRRAKESLGYSWEISDKQEEEIIKSLENPKEAIFICAKHLSDLKNVDFKSKNFDSLTKYELAIVATRYNVGSGDTLERQKGKGLNYGQEIVDNFKNLSELLK